MYKLGCEQTAASMTTGLDLNTTLAAAAEQENVRVPATLNQKYGYTSPYRACTTPSSYPHSPFPHEKLCGFASIQKTT